MKKLLGLLAVFTLAGSTLYAFGRGEPGDSLLFGASYMTLNNPFFVALHDSLELAVEAQGDSIVVLNPDYDQILQISQIEDLLSMGIDALFLNPVDWKGIRPALEAAERAGVPVFVVDAPVYDDSLVTSTIVSDNHEAGVLAALDLVERLDGGNIVILDHPTNKPSIDRVDGFRSVIDDYPKFSVVSQLSAFGTLEGALPKMENALQAHPDIDAVFGSNDPTCLGVVAVLVASKRLDDILVYSVDGSPEGKSMVQDGLIAGTAAQSPIAIGRIAAEIMYRFLAGETVSSFEFVPVSLVTASTVENYPINDWQ